MKGLQEQNPQKTQLVQQQFHKQLVKNTIFIDEWADIVIEIEKVAFELVNIYSSR